MTFDDVTKLLLRFLSRPRNYYGTITIKYQKGEFVNVVSEDSFDTKYLKEKFIEDKEMLVKHGAPNKEDKESSKILTEVKIEEGIVKESKIEKKEEDFKNNNINKGEK